MYLLKWIVELMLLSGAEMFLSRLTGDTMLETQMASERSRAFKGLRAVRTLQRVV